MLWNNETKWSIAKSSYWHIINLEDSVLDFASSNAVDGIFYCCSMKVSIGDKSLHVARLFEDDAFLGLCRSKWHDTLNYVYVEKDTKTKKERDKELN